MEEDESLAIRHRDLNAFATSFGLYLVRSAEIAYDGEALERCVENVEVGTSAAGHVLAAVPIWVEILALGGLEVESVMLGAVLGHGLAVGSVAVESEAVAPSTKTAKAADSRRAVSHPRNNQHEDQHDVTCVVKKCVDGDAAEFVVVDSGAIAAATMKVQPHEQIRI